MCSVRHWDAKHPLAFRALAFLSCLKVFDVEGMIAVMTSEVNSHSYCLQDGDFIDIVRGTFHTLDPCDSQPCEQVQLRWSVLP